MGRLQLVALTAALPVALAVGFMWPGCHPLGSWPGRGAIAWFVLAAGATLFCIRARWHGWARYIVQLVLACLTVAGVGGVVASGLTGAIDRGAQKRTMGDVVSIAVAIESLRREDGTLPRLTSVSDVAAATGASLSAADAWGTPIALEFDGGGYCVVSYGLCGEPDLQRPPGVGLCSQYDGDSPTSTWQADIVLRDGHFVRWPEGIQR